MFAASSKQFVKAKGGDTAPKDENLASIQIYKLNEKTVGNAQKNGFKKQKTDD